MSSTVNGGDASGLLEREHELAALETLIDAGVAGDAGVGLIEGAAGIGKSRLLTEARRRASVSNRDLPMPAAPSMSPTPASPATPASINVSSAASSCSRSSRPLASPPFTVDDITHRRRQQRSITLLTRRLSRSPDSRARPGWWRPGLDGARLRSP